MALAFRLWRDRKGAIAPTVALSLFGLIAAGGIAFDYARVATMDTELQTAADQAALAAASQLDGDTDAQTRATLAAQANGLITNRTLFANDGDSNGTAIVIASVVFYVDKLKTTVATSGTDSNFVEVTVATRRANYAFTPIVAAIGQDVNARAFAGVDSAVCGAVPFFICNPDEPTSNTDVHYPVSIPTGTGIVMAEGGTQWGPGNFGFIDQAGNGANGVAEALASNSLFGQCSPTSAATTETGNILNAVRDSLNMRFDFKPGNNSACKSPPCSPSGNVRKDLVKTATGCSWQQNPATTTTEATTKRYRPTSATPYASTVTPEIMGFPRDLCHAFSATTFSCAQGRVGDGVWDRAAYFRSNHPGLVWGSETGLGADVTRYQTYLWEAQDSARLAAKAGSGGMSAYSAPQATCLAPGLAPDTAGIDRRRLTAAVVNCRRVSATTGLNGKRTIPVAGFIDVFMVEPSINRTNCQGGTGCGVAYTSQNDVYVEVIGTSGTGEGGGTPQITRRSIPYLIE